MASCWMPLALLYQTRDTDRINKVVTVKLSLHVVWFSLFFLHGLWAQWPLPHAQCGDICAWVGGQRRESGGYVGSGSTAEKAPGCLISWW